MEEGKTKAKAQAKATKKYIKSHYEQFNLQFPKGTKVKLSEYAKEHGYSGLTALICELLEKETGISCKLKNALPWMQK